MNELYNWNELYRIKTKYDADQGDVLFRTHRDAINYLKNFHTSEEIDFMISEGLIDITNEVGR